MLNNFINQRWLSFLNIVLISVALSFSTQVKAADIDTDAIEFVDLDGNVTTLKDYRGKWVIVNLWATWCPPCLVEIPDLVMFHETHKDQDAIVLGVNYEAIDPAKVKTFAESQMINYPVVRFQGKVDGQTTPFGPLRGLPTTYMVTPEGQLVAARTGMVDQKMLEEFMQKYEASKK